ncbi:MAG: alpha/beta hydrolase [Oligoflexales bacterium]|nr:alpha/beta hydrolase [Oligoflexales bacterium]
MERKSFSTERGHFSYLHWQAQTTLPTLLFVHATGFNALTYRLNLELLAPSFEIYAVDLRGHGFSKAEANPQKFFSWDIYVQDLLQIIQELPPPIVLAGHSLGSLLCLAIAAKSPQLVSHLLMIEPIIMSPIASKIWALSKWLGFGKQIAIAKRASKRRRHFDSRQQIINAYQGKGAFKSWPQEILVDYVDGGIKPSHPHGVELTCHPKWEAQSFALTAHQTWTWLKNLECKTHLIYGNQTSTISQRSLDVIHESYPQIHTQEYSASHFIPMENKACIRDEIFKLRSMV